MSIFTRDDKAPASNPNNLPGNDTQLNRTSIIAGVAIAAVALAVSLGVLVWYLVIIRRQMREAPPDISVIESTVHVEAIKGKLDNDTDFDTWRYKHSWESTTGRSAFGPDGEVASDCSSMGAVSERSLFGHNRENGSDSESLETASGRPVLELDYEIHYRRSSLDSVSVYSVQTEVVDPTVAHPC